MCGTNQPTCRGVRYNGFHWRQTGAGSGQGLITVNLKKILTFAGVGLVLFFLIAQPQEAAALVHNILGTLRGAAEALINFASTLFK
jgi:hypothetical protein